MATVDPSVQEAYEANRQDASGVTWLVVGYEGNTKLVLQTKGSGNAEECAAALADDQCQYGCIRVQFVAEDKTTRTKVCFCCYIYLFIYALGGSTISCSISV